MSKVSMVPMLENGVPAPATRGMGGVSPLDTTAVSAEVGGSIDSVRGEINDAFLDMKKFVNGQPDEIMRICGGHSARLAEIRGRIQRVEDFQRQWRAVRTREVEPALEQLQFQYQVASRLQSWMDLEWRMSTGGAHT